MAYNRTIIDTLNRTASAQSRESVQSANKRCQREGGLQIQCVRWFRYQYPAFSKLLYHAKNESSTYSRRVAIDAAQGVVSGVPDLILALPAVDKQSGGLFLSLGIELKYGKINNQTASQKEFQKYYEAVGHKYMVIRSLDEFITAVKAYMSNVPESAKNRIGKLYYSDPETESNKQKLQRLINKT